MPRPVSALVALALAALLLAPVAAPAAAGEQRQQPATWAVDNDARRQALLHRSWPDDGVPGSVIVTATNADAAAAIAAREGGSVIAARTVLLHVGAGAEAETAARVVARGGVIGVDPDRVRDVAAVPNDQRYTDQWSHVLSNAQPAWDTTTGDPSVRVAVLDTGVDGDHDDLIDNLVEQVDLSSGREVRRTLGSDNDTCNVGHGTFVAGVVGAVGNNATGVAGVAWDVSIVDVALTSRASRCGILDSAIIAGLDHVTNRADPVDVVNLSLGGIADSCPTSLQAALDDARDAGTLVVAAAGNEQGLIDDPVSIPASCDGVVSVGAVGDAGNVAPYSNANEYVDVAAPGGDSSTGRGIVSTAAGGGYAEFEGTSFAAPYVAGVAALLRSVDDTLTPDDLESILESTATDRGTPGRDPEYGWGVVDAGRAVLAVFGGTPTEPQEDPAFPVRTGGSSVERIEPTGTTTQAIAQAVAVSEFTFESLSAMHAVIARDDDFADALAGSALGFGVGPLLFTRSSGQLAGVTRTELRRVLEPGGTVYLLGGTAALPASLESEITGLGYVPVRLAGPSRQETAVAVAEELEAFLAANEFEPPNIAVVATAYNWPDAVSAGALGAWFGLPILVTQPTVLDEPVRAFLGAREWAGVYVVGGTAAISDDVRRAVRDAAGITSADTPRLAGADRSGTAVAVGAAFERAYAEQFEAAFGEPAIPNVVAAVNLRRADGFAHVLSASSLVGAFAGVFVPVEGEHGTSITDEAQAYACRFPAAGVVVGGEDVVVEDTADLFDELLRGEAPACVG